MRLSTEVDIQGDGVGNMCFVDCGPGLEDLPKIFGFPFNICASAEASNFKFSMHLCLPRPSIKTQPEEK